jgi:hypothetical protein
MNGLAIVVLVLLVLAYFVASIDIIKAYGESEKKMRLQSIQSPEQQDDNEKLKERWLSNFNELLSESNYNMTVDNDAKC